MIFCNDLFLTYPLFFLSYMMFVTGGELKGKRLDYPRGRIRPTMKMVKLAIFNCLGERVKKSRVLDLFSGPGAMGIEALSRGAKEVYFIEEDKRAFTALLKNIKGLPNCYAKRGDVFRSLSRLAGEKFDLVFLDPPYLEGKIEKTLKGIVQFGLLNPLGLIIAEHHKKENWVVPCGLRVIKSKTCGDTRVTFLSPDRSCGCNKKKR